MSDQCCEVVVTAADADWLAGFTRRLVTDRLAACGHLVERIRSVYRWEGAIQDETEARVALHTRAALVPEIVARTNAEHPYDVPCVIALPIDQGNPAYMEWIVTETRQPELLARGAGMTELFHLADRRQWEAARAAGSYRMSTRGRTLEEVGFIHCSLRHQVRGVADALYADADDLVLLVIDGDRVEAPVRYEGPDFPHIYGPLPTAAVVAVRPVTRDAEGRLELPID